jgi:two-component system sensor histidine kinase DegS
LKSLVKTVQDKFALNINLDVIGKIEKYPSEVETMLFRIVQEALNNIGKHAKATEALITIEYSEEKFILTISDNGKGFKLAESIDALPRRGKLGLAGIKERASLLGGTVDVTSSSTKGTCLNIEIPRGEDMGIMENPVSSDYEF